MSGKTGMAGLIGSGTSFAAAVADRMMVLDSTLRLLTLLAGLATGGKLHRT